jgi:3-hydroxyisobutyrate dehydrogenase-like beta-hydroxyacid dehydrogenase
MIFTFVTDDRAMESIFTRPDDNLLIEASGKVFINCATISPDVHSQIAQSIAAAGAEVLEAPMASSVNQARAGTLYLMCAGESALFARLTPLLEDISCDREYVGAIGKALQLKALVNMVMNINTAALAEGLGLASTLGLDLQTVKKVFGKTGADSRVLVTDGDDMIKRDHEAYFTANHAAKDSGIALELAQKAGLDLPLAAATKKQYDLLCKFGLGHLDKSAVSELTFKERRPQ